MPATHRSFVAIFSVSLGVLLAGTAAFSVLTDGNDVFAGVSLESLEEHRDHRTRIAKAARIARGDVETLLVGTSRTEAGMDPSEPAWGGGVVYNAGLGGGNAYESLEVMRLALDSGAPRNIILCLDLFSMRPELRGTRSFDRSLLNPRLDALDYWAGNLVGRDAVERGWRAVRKARKGRPGSNRLDGMRAGSKAGALDHRALFAKIIEGFYVDHYHDGFRFDQGLIERLGELLLRARRAGVKVSVLVSPIHALQLEAIHQAGQGDAFWNLLRELSRAAERANRVDAKGPPVAVWEFSGWAGKLAEPLPPEGTLEPMTWWVESSHFSRALGREVALRVGEGEGADPAFGSRLEPGSLEETIARRLAERVAFRSSNAADLSWLEEQLTTWNAARAEQGARAAALNARR